MELRCPNEPADKKGLLTAPERHEIFSQDFRQTITKSLLSNGQQWFFDKPTVQRSESVGPIVCETCGAEAEESE